MNKDIVIVNTNTLSIFSFVGYMVKNETPKEALKKAIESNKKDIETWKNNILLYGTCKSFKMSLNEYKKNTFEIMTYKEFEILQKDNILNKPLNEITEEQFEEMLNILPPLKWINTSSISMFLMSEFYTNSYTSQYYHNKINNKFYTKLVDAYDRKTWIDVLLKNNKSEVL